MSAYEINQRKVLELEVEIQDLHRKAIMLFGTDIGRCIGDLMTSRVEQRDRIKTFTGEDYAYGDRLLQTVSEEVHAGRANIAKWANDRARAAKAVVWMADMQGAC